MGFDDFPSLYADHFVEVPPSEVRREFTRYGADPLCIDVRPTDCGVYGVGDPAVMAARLVDASAYLGIGDCAELCARRYGEECGSSAWSAWGDDLRREYSDIGGRRHAERLHLDGMAAYVAEVLGRRLVACLWRLHDDMWTANVYAVRVRL